MDAEGADVSLRARELLPGTNQASVFAIGITFSVVAISVMSLRIYCRLRVIGCGLGTDDYLMLLGVICSVGQSIANMVCAWYGAGVHVGSVPLDNYPHLLKSNYANRLLYVFALCFVKLSILVFYLRIDPRRHMRWAVYFLIFTVIGLTVSTACICVFECRPPSLFWDVSGLNADKCMDPGQRQTFFEANGIINIVQDVGIWLIPIPMLWKLQVPRRQKAALLFLFCIGVVALIAGGIRYYYVLKLENEEDIWFYFADSLNWCSIEVYAAIICGSASTFRVFFKRHMASLWGSRENTSGVKQHPYNHSNTGDFALEPYSQTRHKAEYQDETTAMDGKSDGGSESGLNSQRGVLPGNANRGIMMSREVQITVSDGEASGHSQVAPFTQV